MEPVTTTAPEQVRLGYLTCYGRGVRLNLQARCTCWWSGPRRTWGPDSIAEEQADLDTHLNQSAHHRLESGDRAATNLHGRCGHVHSLDDDCAVPYDSPAGQLVRACQATLTRPRAALDRRNQTRRMGGQPTRRSRNRSPPRQRRPRPHRSRRPPHRGRSHPTLGPAPRIPRQGNAQRPAITHDIQLIRLGNRATCHLHCPDSSQQPPRLLWPRHPRSTPTGWSTKRSRQRSGRFPPSPSTTLVVPPCSSRAPTRPHPPQSKPFNAHIPPSDDTPEQKELRQHRNGRPRREQKLFFRKPLQGGRLLRRRPPTTMSVLKVPLLCRGSPTDTRQLLPWGTATALSAHPV